MMRLRRFGDDEAEEEEVLRGQRTRDRADQARNALDKGNIDRQESRLRRLKY
jgi:hypothetical protein